MLVLFLLSASLIIFTLSYLKRPGKTGLKKVLYKLNNSNFKDKIALKGINVETLILGCTDTAFLIYKKGQMSILSQGNPS